MPPDGAGRVLVVGGTAGIGRLLARRFVEQGRELVLSGRDPERARAVAAELGGGAVGIGLDLARPEQIAGRLEGVGRVDQLVLVAIDRDDNAVADYDVARATRLVTLKLVGYTETVHALLPRLHDDSSIVLFGGLARDMPYRNSTTITTVNYGVTGLMHTLAVELAPVRVNAVHPGVVGDSPYWRDRPGPVRERWRARTPTGRLATMADVVDAVVFLLENRSVNAVDLRVDGGILLLL